MCRRRSRYSICRAWPVRDKSSRLSPKARDPYLRAFFNGQRQSSSCSSRNHTHPTRRLRTLVSYKVGAVTAHHRTASKGRHRCWLAAPALTYTTRCLNRRHLNRTCATRRPSPCSNSPTADCQKEKESNSCSPIGLPRRSYRCRENRYRLEREDHRRPMAP